MIPISSGIGIWIRSSDSVYTVCAPDLFFDIAENFQKWLKGRYVILLSALLYQLLKVFLIFTENSGADGGVRVNYTSLLILDIFTSPTVISDKSNFDL